MSAAYVIRRILLFFVVVSAATTLIFFLPKLAPGRNPIVERIGMMVATGGVNASGMQAMVDAYQAKFGLDKPLWQQYLTYVADISHLDFGYSLTQYPTAVLEVIRTALPWTLTLLTVTTLLAFSLGGILGALLAWPRAPKALQALLPPLFIFSVIPYYLFGLILVYLFAFQSAFSR
jgi:peptide/nickel transport system permease protein